MRDFVLGIAVGATGLAVSLAVAVSAGWISLQPITAVPWARLSGAAPVLILNVVCQHLLLCGYIFQLIRTRAGFNTAAVGSVLLFCTYHAAAFHGSW